MSNDSMFIINSSIHHHQSKDIITWYIKIRKVKNGSSIGLINVEKAHKKDKKVSN